MAKYKAVMTQIHNAVALDQPAKLTDQFNMITANFKAGLVRNDTMAGREYIVVPMVMIVEGILNGSNGPLLYPAEHLAKAPDTWNMKPVVVYHPEINGRPTSACDPDILTNRQVGVILNTHFKDGKLRAEAWIEIARAKLVDNRILEAIENGNMMELSTGLLSDVLREEGELNGKPYAGIALNYRPDHLALLPDQKGACSLEDGAGFLRNSANTDIRAHNQQSHSNLRLALSGLIDENAYIEDVYDGFFVYEMGGAMYAQDYEELSPAGAQLIGEKREVVRVTEYRTLDGSFVGNSEKELMMNKALLVAAIIANSGQFTEEDKEVLMGMDEKILEKMSKITPVVNEGEGEGAGAGEGEGEGEDEKVVTANKEPTVEEYISNAPAGIRDMIISGLQTHAAEKNKIVTAILANERNTFTKEVLAAKPLAELKSLALLAAPVVNKSARGAVDFSALGLNVANTQTTVTEEPLTAPTMNFDK